MLTLVRYFVHQKDVAGFQGQSLGQVARRGKAPTSQAETFLAFGRSMHESRKFACFLIFENDKRITDVRSQMRSLAKMSSNNKSHLGM